MEKEIWKDIPGYEGYYQVSNLGNVKSLTRLRKLRLELTCTVKEKMLKPQKATNGYLFIILSKDGKTRQILLHRLVMLSFIGKSKLEVNHKDGNKTNNCLSNLEYVTHIQNQYHSFRVLKRKPVKSWLGKRGMSHNKSIAIVIENINTGQKNIYGSYRIAEEETHIARSTIRKYINKNRVYKNKKIYEYEK